MSRNKNMVYLRYADECLPRMAFHGTKGNRVFFDPFRIRSVSPQSAPTSYNRLIVIAICLQGIEIFDGARYLCLISVACLYYGSTPQTVKNTCQFYIT